MLLLSYSATFDWEWEGNQCQREPGLCRRARERRLRAPGDLV